MRLLRDARRSVAGLARIGSDFSKEELRNGSLAAVSGGESAGRCWPVICSSRLANRRLGTHTTFEGESGFRVSALPASQCKANSERLSRAEKKLRVAWRAREPNERDAPATCAIVSKPFSGRVCSPPPLCPANTRSACEQRELRATPVRAAARGANLNLLSFERRPLRPPPPPPPPSPSSITIGGRVDSRQLERPEGRRDEGRQFSRSASCARGSANNEGGLLVLSVLLCAQQSRDWRRSRRRVARQSSSKRVTKLRDSRRRLH